MKKVIKLYVGRLDIPVVLAISCQIDSWQQNWIADDSS